MRKKALPEALLEARDEVVRIKKRDSRFYWSKEWREFRRLYIEWHGGYCDNCGNDTDLQLHHDYHHEGLLPGETSLKGDWKLLCDQCHSKMHGKYKVKPSELESKGGVACKK